VGTNTGLVFAATGPAGRPKVVDRHGAPVRAVAVLAGGTIASADTNGDLQVVTASGSRSSVELKSEVRSLATDGRRLFVGVRSGAVLVLEAADLTRSPMVLAAHSTDASAAAVSPDGRLLATGGDDRAIVVWDIGGTKRPTQRLRLIGQGDRITSLSFSPDGRWLASGGEDRNVILWDLQRGEQIGEPVLLPAIPSIAFTTDPSGGAELEVAGRGLARWPMRPQAWASIACQILNGRTLTAAERQRFLRGSSPAARCAS
jgi:WD40 repeat protein